MSAKSPLNSVSGFTGYTTAFHYKGQEIAIVAKTPAHIKKVFETLNPDVKYDKTLTGAAVVMPAKTTITPYSS